MKKPCLQARGSRDTHGYGTVRIGEKLFRAHRLAYQLHVGGIPLNHQIDHLCHNEDLSCPGGPTCSHRGCIEPTHLEPVLPRENIIRGGRNPTAQNANATHCKRGLHELVPENCYRRPDGKSRRQCRACVRARGKAKRLGISVDEVLLRDRAGLPCTDPAEHDRLMGQREQTWRESPQDRAAERAAGVCGWCGGRLP